MTDIDRRAILRGAAWAAPVIALAVAAPTAAASETPPKCTNLYDFTPAADDPNNRVRITIANGQVTFTIVKHVDSVDFNIQWLDKGPHFNYHPNHAGAVGETFTFPIRAQECDVKWIQAHGNNVHYYGGGVFQ